MLKSDTDPLSSRRRELAPASVSAKCIVHGAAHSRDFISRKAHLSAIKFGVAIERAESIQLFMNESIVSESPASLYGTPSQSSIYCGSDAESISKGINPNGFDQIYTG